VLIHAATVPIHIAHDLHHVECHPRCRRDHPSMWPLSPSSTPSLNSSTPRLPRHAAPPHLSRPGQPIPCFYCARAMSSRYSCYSKPPACHVPPKQHTFLYVPTLCFPLHLPLNLSACIKIHFCMYITTFKLMPLFVRCSP
jgi:hypothetical protein